MKIKKLSRIKKYKSFQDFRWSNFLNTKFHNETNILYGENGSGKSSICNILKSLSQNKDFVRYFPEEVELLVDSTMYKYENRLWSSNISRSSILFFDREFVDRNVHLGRDRGTQQGEQEQESGNLIIEFDGDAINLRSIRDKLSGIKDEKNQKLEDFKRNNKKILDFELKEGEDSLFKKYRRKNKAEITKLRESIDENRNELDGTIKTDKKLLQKATEIQTIKDVEDINTYVKFSSNTTYQAIFNFDLKEQVKIEAADELIKQIKEHKEFFESGFEIRKGHSNQCPFCGAKDREAEIKKIIDIYNRIYDDSYRKLKAVFDKNKQSLIGELNQIQEAAKGVDLNSIFITIKKLSEQYSIKNLYAVEEEEKFRKSLSDKKIEELKKRISTLEKPNKEDISSLYGEAKMEVDQLSKFLLETAKLIKDKNKIIKLFKKEHTSEKLENRINKNQATFEKIRSELNFIDSQKIDSQILKLGQLKELGKFERAFDKAKDTHKSVRETYEQYCSTGAFAKTLSKIESYFKNFKFGFKLELDTSSRQTGSTKELPFAFKVIDPDGNERDLKEGLSESEMQVLSLCFFFAFLDIQSNKSQKILVFDDPITSLDDSNLSSLVDLIADEKNKFSQVFIFSHHRTFFKFLRKRFDEHSNEYNIVRNKAHLGGSFLCKSKEERFIEKLKNLETHLSQLARNPSGFDVELQIVEYGQYLRYETEHFIKCRLLHWNESSEFAKVVEGIKDNKKVSDTDLDKIKQVYSFCNWTTSHVDVGDDHGLAQLKEKIADFVGISDKY